LKPYYKSQSIPIDQGLVRNLVGKTFKLETENKNMAVVFMYDKHNEECWNFTPVYQ